MATIQYAGRYRYQARNAAVNLVRLAAGIGKKTRITVLCLLCVFVVGIMLPEHLVIPVQGASDKDWNHATFWHEPWGKSVVHKGIDIFAPAGRPVISSTYGVVLFAGQWGIGGNVVAVLGPKWRVHYYAHLKDIHVGPLSVLRTAQTIGTVGQSGNAQGKPAHLHYTILTIIPYIGRWDAATQGWKKMFILDPGQRLLEDAS